MEVRPHCWDQQERLGCGPEKEWKRDDEQWVEHSGVAVALTFVSRVERSPGSLS